MPTKRDLKNARRLEKLKARAALREAGNAPNEPVEATVALPVTATFEGKFSGSSSPLSETVTDTGETFAEVVRQGRKQRAAVKVDVGTPDMPCNAEPTPVITTTVQVIEDVPPVPDAVLVRVYLKPRNPRMRLIEMSDGSHGRLWLKPSAHPMIGWMVWAKPQAGSEGDYDLHGRYNGRGTRTA